MNRRHSPAYLTREQSFNDKFPLGIVGLLAIIQMITTFGIFALEIGHILVNIQLTNLFAGIWASIPFTILWISMFATVCCCRRRSCATHAVIQNFISFIFASVLIGINIAFLRRPNQCFFTEGVCNSLTWASDIYLPLDCFNGNLNGCDNTRLNIIKAQLAAGVIMAVTCFTYLILYCAVASRVSRTDQRQVPTASNAVMAPVYQHPIPSVINYQHQSYTNPPHLYQPSAPVMMPAYQQVPLGNNNGNYLPSNSRPTLYPQIPNDRF